jgi:hypothetical protein
MILSYKQKRLVYLLPRLTLKRDRFDAKNAAYSPTLERSIPWIETKSGYTKEVAILVNSS